MPPDIDVETLRLLVTVSERGSLGAAARTVGISQPAASARVRAFEARWQLSVLERSPRGSTMTTDGMAVVSWAREVLHSVDTMRKALEAMSTERHSETAIGASLTIAEFILPRWLGELHTRMPDVHPRLHVVNSGRVAEMVRDGSVDVGFIETAIRPKDLSRKEVGSDRLIVVVHSQHPWARRSIPISTQTLGQAHWVLREAGSGTRSTFERALGQLPLVALEASSATALTGAALAAVGPAVVSARAVTGELETGRLVEVPTRLDLLRPLTAIWRPDRRLSRGVSELLSIAAGARHGQPRRPH